MFGFIRKLREENEELHSEKLKILQREAATIDAYYAANKSAIESRAETEKWKEKYTALNEKYINLLERYEKALAAKDINVRSKGVE